MDNLSTHQKAPDVNPQEDRLLSRLSVRDSASQNYEINNPPDLISGNASPHKPWYKQIWFIVVVIFVALWFGLPPVLRLFPAAKNSVSPGFTVAPGVKSGNVKEPVNLDNTNEPAWGLTAAPVTIVEFGDYQCPYCGEAEPILQQLRQKYGEGVRFVYRDFPIADVHSEAIPAAEAAQCANQQSKFWPYHDQLFAQQDKLGAELYNSLAQSLKLDMNKFKSCLDGHLSLAGIKKDYEAGLAVGVNGTPTFFVNGYALHGVVPLATWDQIIATVLQLKFKKTP